VDVLVGEYVVVGFIVSVKGNVIDAIAEVVALVGPSVAWILQLTRQKATKTTTEIMGIYLVFSSIISCPVCKFLHNNDIF
jgi:hypothetical protein